MKPKISVIVPWNNPGSIYRRRAWEWLRARYENLLAYDFDVDLVYGSSDAEPFSRGGSRNFLVGRSKEDILLIADADTVFNKDQIKVGVDLLGQGAPWVIPYGLGRYYNLTRSASADVVVKDPKRTIPEPVDSTEWDHKLDSWAGLLLMTKSAFNQVGGYDERFIGWGYEDNAFRAAMDSVVGQHQRTPHYALHLWHPAIEAENFGQPFIHHNRALYQTYERG